MYWNVIKYNTIQVSSTDMLNKVIENVSEMGVWE